ncbi:aminomethyl-transferring glycine dehydrogenase subunit GcvPA [soil metagenome]
MPFIPHTEAETAEMLAEIGVDDIETLFDEIPEALRVRELEGIPEALSEMEVARIMHARAARDGMPLNFIGAGAYEHHIPAAVWQIATRGEFYSAYTPYQAEASQGTLQLIYEYQTMMANLTGMEASNASLYDGASAMAEAALMAVRANRRSKSARVLVADTVQPIYRRVAATIGQGQSLTFEVLPWERRGGHTNASQLEQWSGEDVTALIVQQPNFFGVLEDVDELTDWAHAQGALVIAVVNPISLAVLKPPGEWGAGGADIVCGEGQPLGVPLSSGGPYFGFMACKQDFVRQMPGRLVGRTVDLDGMPGFTLTLQAREQHIRRSRATSNICTNQGLLVTAAAIYLSLLGAAGLERVAAAAQVNAHALADRLTKLEGVERQFSRPHFHEIVLSFDRPVAGILEQLARRGILGGYELARDYPELSSHVLVCATETKTDRDIEAYAEALGEVLQQTQVA